MTETEYTHFIKDCEELIRSGRAQAASQALRNLKMSGVPRSCILPLANLARRTGLNSLGLKLLGALILEDKTKRVGPLPTASELAEYAVLLHRNGALEEALDILDSLDDWEIPAVLLYRAFCYFNEFDHESATEALLKYTQRETSPYMALVGHVNLAAAYVLGYEHEKAFALLEAHISSAKEGGHQRLVGNCLELRAQLHLRDRNFAKAQEDLNSATSLIREFQNLDFLWLQKWQALLEDLRTGQVDKLRAFRETAENLKSWDNIREADRFCLSVRFESHLLDYLVFGTPYPHYRDLIYRETGQRPASPIFILGNPSVSGFDILSGKAAGKSIFSPGKQSHRLLAVLATDLYRPFLVGELFSKLFENEKFNIFSSPNRIHQLVRRTRKQLLELNIPIDIIQLEGRYKLVVSEVYSVRIPLEPEPIDTLRLQWKNFVEKFEAQGAISATEARAQLKMPRTSFQRLITWAIGQGLLQKIGDHKLTLYKITSHGWTCRGPD